MSQWLRSKLRSRPSDTNVQVPLEPRHVKKAKTAHNVAHHQIDLGPFPKQLEARRRTRRFPENRPMFITSMPPKSPQEVFEVTKCGLATKWYSEKPRPIPRSLTKGKTR